MLKNFFYGLMTTGYHKGNILLRPKSIKILPPTGHTTILHHTEVRHGSPDYYGFYAAVRYYRTTIQVYAWGIKGMSGRMCRNIDQLKSDLLTHSTLCTSTSRHSQLIGSQPRLGRPIAAFDLTGLMQRCSISRALTFRYRRLLSKLLSSPY